MLSCDSCVEAWGGISEGSTSVVSGRVLECMHPGNWQSLKIEELSLQEAKITYIGGSPRTPGGWRSWRAWQGGIGNLLNIWEKARSVARIPYEKTPKLDTVWYRVGVPKTTDTCTNIWQVPKHVNRGRDTSLTDLLQSNLWNDTWIQFVSEVEDAVGLCRLDTKPLTTDWSLQKSIRGVFRS